MKTATTRAPKGDEINRTGEAVRLSAWPRPILSRARGYTPPVTSTEGTVPSAAPPSVPDTHPDHPTADQGPGQSPSNQPMSAPPETPSPAAAPKTAPAKPAPEKKK